MRQIIRIVLTICALFVLSLAVHAEDAQESLEPALALEPDQCEQAWEARIEDDSVSFAFSLNNCGETVAFQPERGALEVSYRFAHTDWSHFSVWYDEEGENGGTTYGFDPFGDDAVLHARCFLIEEDGKLLVCQCFEITTKTGTTMHRSVHLREISADQQSFWMRFESFPLEPIRSEESAPSDDDPVQSGDVTESIDVTRCWTYCSSDDRLLWQVELTGSFSGDLCESAAGCVTVIDDAWICEQAEFFPDGACAVALVTLRRTTLGIPTATRTYEFRLPPP